MNFQSFTFWLVAVLVGLIAGIFLLFWWLGRKMDD
jgi:hypothetical protein